MLFQHTCEVELSERHRVEAQGFALPQPPARGTGSKSKTPAREAVCREAEEDWGATIEEQRKAPRGPMIKPGQSSRFRNP